MLETWSCVAKGADSTGAAGYAPAREAAGPQERDGLVGGLRPKTAGRCGWRRRPRGRSRPAGGFRRRRPCRRVSPSKPAEEGAQPMRHAAGDHADLAPAPPSRGSRTAAGPRAAPEQQRRHRPAQHARRRAAAACSGEPRQTTRRHRRCGRIAQRLQRDQAAQAVGDDVDLAVADRFDQRAAPRGPARRPRSRRRRLRCRSPPPATAPRASASPCPASTSRAAGRRGGQRGPSTRRRRGAG